MRAVGDTGETQPDFVLAMIKWLQQSQTTKTMPLLIQMSMVQAHFHTHTHTHTHTSFHDTIHECMHLYSICR